MLDHAEEAWRLTRGRTRAELDTDRLFALAMTRLVEIIGEAASKVTEQTRAASTDIPWRSITGMRNRLIHGYDKVDHDVLWDVLTKDLPQLADQLKVLLKGA